MLNVSEQLEKLFEVYEQEDQFNNRFELFNRVLKVIGNILFVVACFIILWKGLIYLFDYFFSPTSHDSTTIAIRSAVNKLWWRSPAIVAGIIAIFLIVIRVVVKIKLYISPFQILSIVGMAILVKKLWEIIFSKDPGSYLDFLKEFGKKLFE